MFPSITGCIRYNFYSSPPNACRGNSQGPENCRNKSAYLCLLAFRIIPKSFLIRFKTRHGQAFQIPGLGYNSYGRAFHGKG
jgi:hypothetical protein